jgi:hypothetical protein
MIAATVPSQWYDENLPALINNKLIMHPACDDSDGQQLRLLCGPASQSSPAPGSLLIDSAIAVKGFDSRQTNKHMHALQKPALIFCTACMSVLVTRHQHQCILEYLP